MLCLVEPGFWTCQNASGIWSNKGCLCDQQVLSSLAIFSGHLDICLSRWSSRSLLLPVAVAAGSPYSARIRRQAKWHQRTVRGKRQENRAVRPSWHNSRRGRKHEVLTVPLTVSRDAGSVISVSGDQHNTLINQIIAGWPHVLSSSHVQSVIITDQ